MRLEFTTNEYEFSHGHRPRGRGWWAFKIGYDNEPFFAPGVNTITEAKKIVKAEAKRRHTTLATVVVLP